jgi:endogenous inhibitor of DNA gyrase (YacG/DUF329 family)
MMMTTLMTMTTLRMMMMSKKCQQCEKSFEAKDELDNFCSSECKQEALAELDSNSDECLSCQ